MFISLEGVEAVARFIDLVFQTLGRNIIKVATTNGASKRFSWSMAKIRTTLQCAINAIYNRPQRQRMSLNKGAIPTTLSSSLTSLCKTAHCRRMVVQPCFGAASGMQGYADGTEQIIKLDQSCT